MDLWCDEVLINGSGTLSYIELEVGCGLLVYLSRIFLSIFPYLKGLYNKINSWRLGSNRCGCKYPTKEWKYLLDT